MTMRVLRKLLGAGVALLLPLAAAGRMEAQMGGPPGGGDPGDGSGQTAAFGNARMVRGTVTAVAPDRLTLKTETGDLYQVLITPNTQVRKGRDQARVADIHAGDGAGAMGEVDAGKKTVHALFVALVDAEQIRKAREAMGKTFISGTVLAIDELKLTIKRTDDVTQVIQVDEDTSFRKGGRGMNMALGADGAGGVSGGRGQRPGAVSTAPESMESLTLADVKVGSVVGGPGTLKNGVFIPTTLAIGEPGGGRQGGGGGRRRDANPGSTTPPATPTEPKK